MFRTIEDFLTDWEQESTSTLKIFTALTDDSLTQKVHKEGRTLSRLAWHITETIGEMLKHAGLEISDEIKKGTQPAQVSKFVEAYEQSSRAAVDVVKKQWTNAMLPEEIPMYGQQWRRGDVLSSLIRHQTHHRAQMTVLMRQAGLKVPGLYGPAKEEWSAYGMEAEQ